jgi:hypothetical protein
MNNFISGLLATLVLLLVPVSNYGQEAHHSRISIAHPGFELLKLDLKSVVDLADKEEQKQWVNIQDYIDMFQIGIDGSRPVRVDVLTGVSPTCFMVWIPLAKPEDPKKGLPDEFRDSLDAFGYVTRWESSQNKNLFEIASSEGAKDMGWFRVIPEIEYGVFVLTTDKEDMQLLKQLIIKASDPRTEVSKLLGPGISMGAELINDAESAEDQAKRKSASAELRKISMDTIQKRPEESTTEHEIRRQLMKSQLDESERLMVEAKEIRMLGNLDRKTNRATLNITATGIADTSLDKTIRAIGVRPSDFASIARFEGSVMSIRMNHPIDSLRQGNVVDFLTLVRKDIDSRIDASKQLSADEQSSTRKLLSGLMDVTVGGIHSGHINAMLEAVTNDKGEFTVIGSVSAPEATRLNDLLPLLKSTGKGNDAEMNVGKAGNVSIHRIELAEGYVELIDRVFGSKRDVFVGVDAERIWLAAGPGALELMSATIEKLGPPAMTDSAIYAEAHLLPWMKRLDEIAKALPEETTKEKKEIQRARARTRARAIAALQSDDLAVIDIRSKDGIFTGALSFETGIMRFAGKAIAAFAKENLQQ